MFQGWYTAREGGARVTAETAMVNSDVTLYAHWEPLAAGSCREKAIPFPFGPSVAAYPVTLAKEWLAGEGRYDETSGVLYCKSFVARGKVYTLALPVGQKFTVSCEDAGAIVEYATSGTLCLCLVDARDIRFVQLFLLWCAARPPARLAEFVQVQAVRNFKNAARYDLDLANITLPDGASASVRDTGLRLLDSMARFFADFPRGEAAEIIAFERGKLERPESRYAAQVLERFGGTFAEKGLAHARELTEDANV